MTKFRTCVTVAESTPGRTMRNLKKALESSDLAELRLDFLPLLRIPDVLEMARDMMGRIICTLRPESEGGNFSGSGRRRISLLKLAAGYNPYLLDIEYNTARRSRALLEHVKCMDTNILLSWHDFDGTPGMPALITRLDRMRQLSNYVKIVTSTRDVADASRVLSLYARAGETNLVAFAMGEQGRISRILCLYLGSPFTYVSLGKAVAPGQYSVREIRKIIG